MELWLIFGLIILIIVITTHTSDKDSNKKTPKSGKGASYKIDGTSSREDQLRRGRELWKGNPTFSFQYELENLSELEKLRSKQHQPSHPRKMSLKNKAKNSRGLKSDSDFEHVTITPDNQSRIDKIENHLSNSEYSYAMRISLKLKPASYRNEIINRIVLHGIKANHFKSVINAALIIPTRSIQTKQLNTIVRQAIEKRRIYQLEDVYDILISTNISEKLITKVDEKLKTFSKGNKSSLHVKHVDSSIEKLGELRRSEGHIDKGSMDMSDEGKADITGKKDNNKLVILKVKVETTNIPVSFLPYNIVQRFQCISDLCDNGLPFVIRVANDAGTQFVLDHIGINIEEYRNYMSKIMGEVRQITIGWGGMVLNSMDQGIIFEYRARKLPVYPNYLTNEDGPIAGVARGDRLIFAQDVEENSKDVILFIPRRHISNFPGIYTKDVFPTNYSTLQRRECIYIYTGLADNPAYWSYTELITTIYDLTINLYHLISENSSIYFDNTMSESHLTIIIGDNDTSKFNMFAFLSKVNPLEVREKL